MIMIYYSGIMESYSGEESEDFDNKSYIGQIQIMQSFYQFND